MPTLTKVPGNVQVDTARVRMSRTVDPADAANIADNLQRQIYTLATSVSSLVSSSSSSSSSSGAPGYVVPNVGGVFTPDLSKGANQIIPLTSDARVALPIGAVAAVDTNWRMTIQQDATGGWSTQLDDGYVCAFTLANPQSAALTQIVANFTTDQTVATAISGPPSTNQPIT